MVPLDGEGFESIRTQHRATIIRVISITRVDRLEWTGMAGEGCEREGLNNNNSTSACPISSSSGGCNSGTMGDSPILQ